MAESAREWAKATVTVPDRPDSWLLLRRGNRCCYLSYGRYKYECLVVFFFRGNVLHTHHYTDLERHSEAINKDNAHASSMP